VTSAEFIALAALGLVNLLLTLTLLGLAAKARSIFPASDSPAAATRKRTGPGLDLVGQFEVQAENGVTITDKTISARQVLIGFFAQGCPRCDEVIPKFTHVAAGWHQRGEVIAVLRGEPERIEPKAARLRPYASIISGKDAVVLRSALGVTGYPTLAVLSGGRIIARATQIEDLIPE